MLLTPRPDSLLLSTPRSHSRDSTASASWVKRLSALRMADDSEESPKSKRANLLTVPPRTCKRHTSATLSARRQSVEDEDLLPLKRLKELSFVEKVPEPQHEDADHPRRKQPQSVVEVEMQPVGESAAAQRGRNLVNQSQNTQNTHRRAPAVDNDGEMMDEGVALEQDLLGDGVAVVTDEESSDSDSDVTPNDVFLPRLPSILPEQVVRDWKASSLCQALVPYVPRSDVLLRALEQTQRDKGVVMEEVDDDDEDEQEILTPLDPMDADDDDDDELLSPSLTASVVAYRTLSIGEVFEDDL